MDSGTWRRGELGDFLRTRRGQLVRADLGLPPVGRRRTTGLRREEVAFLSGVSVTWYTWLEQGRDIQPSRQVLDAIARTLRLSPPEHAYVLSLAGYSAPPPPAEPIPQAAPPHVQRLLDALDSYPAYAIAPDWGISGWNPAYARLYPNVAAVPVSDRNLLWLVFTDPYVRDLLPDWESDSRRFLANSAPRPVRGWAIHQSRIWSGGCWRRVRPSVPDGTATTSRALLPGSVCSTTHSSANSTSNTTGWRPRTIPICIW